MTNIIPDIFRSEKDQITLPTVYQIQSDSQFVDMIAHLSQFNQLDIPETKDQLQQLLDGESNPDNRAVLLTGIGRCIIREGDFLIGAGTLGYAYSLLNDTSTDNRAFVLLEMAGFLAIVGGFDMALMLLDKIPQLTNSEYLLRITKYYYAVHRLRKNDLSVIDDLLDSVQYFKKNEIYSTLAFHYKIIGNAYRWKKEYEQTREYYQKAQNICKEQNYTHIQSAVLHDLAMLEYRLGDVDLGIKTLRKAHDLADNHYTRGFTMSSLGFIFLKQNDYERAMLHFEKALAIIVEHGLFHMIPGVCNYLGQCHEKYHQLKLARMYHQKAFEAANELIRQHFPYNGDRLRAVQSYVKFLEQYNLVDGDFSEHADLSFTIDKTLKEIRGLFQGVLLHFAAKREGSVKKAAQYLSLPVRSFHNSKVRAKPFFSEYPPIGLTQFIKLNYGLNWIDFNKKFDAEVLQFQQKTYSTKKQMAAKLGISYPHLIKLSNDGQKYLVSSTAGIQPQIALISQIK